MPEPDDRKSKTRNRPKPELASTSPLTAAVKPDAAAMDSGATLGWRSHRRIVEDLSDSLAKNWRFKLQVCAIVIGLSVAILAVITLVVGGRLIDVGIAVAEARLSSRITELTGRVDNRMKAVDSQVDTVRMRVEERITKQFEQPQIRETVQKVAETAAAKVISDQVQPAEAKVAARLKSFETFLDERKAQYDADQAVFRAELDTLKKRNELTRLADRAIGDGSLGEYQRLLRISHEEFDPELKAAADAEVFRVVSAYGTLSPSRVGGISINAPAVNPAKREEAELTEDELLVVLRGNEPLARARAALIFQDRPKTFRLAEAVEKALQTDRHLEALRYEKSAFAHLTGFVRKKGALDASEEIEWWEENVERLRKELPK
jgi:hypothetical protein